MSGLRDFAARLRRLAAGADRQPAAEAAATYLLGRIRTALAGHVRTGRALSTAEVVVRPDGIEVRLEPYAKFIPDCPYGREIPEEDRERIGEIRAAEVRKVLEEP